MFGPGLADQQTLSYIEKASGATALLSVTESRNPFLLQMPTGRTTQTQWRPLVQQQPRLRLACHSATVQSVPTRRRPRTGLRPSDGLRPAGAGG